MSEIQITFQDMNLGGKPAKLITFTGQLDETNVDHEAKQIYQVVNEMAVPVLLLNFEGLEYMNSKSIGYVTDWFTKVSEKGGSMGIIGPKPNILDILKVVGITQIVTVYNSLDEAKAALGGGGEAPAAPAETPAPEAPAAPAETPAPATPAPATPAAPSAPEAPAAPAPAAPAETPAPATPAAPAPEAPAETPAPAATAQAGGPTQPPAGGAAA